MHRFHRLCTPTRRKERLVQHLSLVLDRFFYRLDSNSASASTMKIGTHDGVFHCDEVLACYMLKRLPEFKDAQIVRSRDLKKLDECDIVVDVGAVYNHERKRYDHHQNEFTETLSTLRPELGNTYSIKLSSAGLIYTHYGEKVIETFTVKESPLGKEDLNTIYKKVYENLIQEVDAIDNGIPMADTEPKYNIRTHLSARISRLNPEWNSREKLDIDEMFITKAMPLAGEEFEHTVNYFLNIWLPARDFVKTAIEERKSVHSSGQILELRERVPWQYHLFSLEEELGLGDEIKYVIFCDKPKSWRIQAVPVAPNSFVLRKPLNKNWWGVRDDLLSEKASVDGCIFCHSNGFIGGNVTREGAIKMAILSLEASTEADH